MNTQPSEKSQQFHNKDLRAPSSRGEAQVLLVEDDLTLEQIFSRIFQIFPFKVAIDSVSNGEAALQLFKAKSERHYSLVITDIFLDGKFTGFDLWKLFQKIHPQVPMLFMSTLPFQTFTQFIGTKIKKNHFLQKPLNIEQCQIAIKTVLQPHFKEH